jgi:lipopolysaccharide/colanic/teichoic acid biosynthesis glycosyltransferase
MMQRIFDILFSGLALVVLAPLLVPVVLILRFTGEGEIFFGQERVGRGGEPFRLLKFATMLKDSPNIGTGTITTRDDPRVLPFGKFLRSTKINELPQLLNVLRGDMSVIGPRPQTRRCFDAFPGGYQAEIVKVRPGLSGAGAVAFRAEDRMMDDADSADRFYDEVIMPYKGALEAWYVRNADLTHYFALIGLTCWVIVFSSSTALWRLFSDLPAAPPALRPYFGLSDSAGPAG